MSIQKDRDQLEKAKDRLAGCYVTVPTMFKDPDLEVDSGRHTEPCAVLD